MERIALINDFLSDDNTHVIKTPIQIGKIPPQASIPKVNII